MLSFHVKKVFGNFASCNYCAKPNAENLLYAEVQPIVYKILFYASANYRTTSH